MICSLTIRLTAIAIVFCMLTGCTTMQALPSTRAVDVESNIVIGDRYRNQHQCRSDCRRNICVTRLMCYGASQLAIHVIQRAFVY